MEHNESNNFSQKRPLIITIICIIGFITALLVILRLLFIPEVATKLREIYGKQFVPAAISLVVIGLIALIGFWKMRKWGVYLYTLMAILGIVHAVFLQLPGRIGYLGPVIIVIIGFINIRKMK